MKNVPYDSTEDDVRAALRYPPHSTAASPDPNPNPNPPPSAANSVCGRIASVRLPSWGHTSKLKVPLAAAP